MSIDCVDSTSEITDIYDSEENIDESPSSLWNGRSVKILTQQDPQLIHIAQFFNIAIQHLERLLNSEAGGHRFDLIELTEEIADEISLNFDQYFELAHTCALYNPAYREFALADPARYEEDILQCKNIFKSAVKGVKKCAKKVAHGVKKGAENVASFVKDHKKEIMISAAVVAAVTGAYLISGALTTAAAADGSSGKKREDEEDPTTDPDSSSTAIPSTPSSAPIANDLFQPDKTPEDNNRSASEQSIFPSIPAPPKDPEFDPHAYFGNPQTNFFENLKSGNFDPNLNTTSEELSKIDGFKKERDITISPSTFPSIDNLSPYANAFWQSAFSNYLATLQNRQLFFDSPKNNVPSNFSSVSTAYAPPPPERFSLWHMVDNFLESFIDNCDSKGIIPSQLATAISSEYPFFSCHVETEGTKFPHIRIGVINGMATSFSEAKSHLNHIKKFAGDGCVEKFPRENLKKMS